MRRLGFQIRDLQVASRFNASNSTTSIHSMRSSTASTANSSCSHGALSPCSGATQSKRLGTARRLQQLIFIASLASLATASGQTAPAGRFPEPLEKYDMAPAPKVYRLDTSPRMISQYGPFVSFQVNVDAQGNNIVGDAANEPSISVDPTDGNKVAIGWRQFDTWTVQLPARPAMGTRPMQVSLGISPAFWKTAFSAATR